MPLFRRVLVPVGPEFVEPRDTVGKLLLGERAANAIFVAFVRNRVGALLTYVTLLAAGVGGTLAFAGDLDADVGWVVLLAVPNGIATISIMNVPLLRCIMRTFEFSLVFGLGLVWVACLADSVRLERARVVALAINPLNMFQLACVDALPLAKKKPPALLAALRIPPFLILVLLQAYMLLSYYVGHLQRFTPRIIPLNYGDVNMSINVLQVGMSAMQVTLIFNIRTLAVMMFYPAQRNRKLAIRAAVEYVLVEDAHSSDAEAQRGGQPQPQAVVVSIDPKPALP